MGYFHPENEVALYFGLGIGSVAKRLGKDAFLTLVDAAAEEIGTGGRYDLDPVPRLPDRAFVQPLEFHDLSPLTLYLSVLYHQPGQK